MFALLFIMTAILMDKWNMDHDMSISVNFFYKSLMNWVGDMARRDVRSRIMHVTVSQALSSLSACNTDESGGISEMWLWT